MQKDCKEQSLPCASRHLHIRVQWVKRITAKIRWTFAPANQRAKEGSVGLSVPLSEHRCRNGLLKNSHGDHPDHTVLLDNGEMAKLPLQHARQRLVGEVVRG